MRRSVQRRHATLPDDPGYVALRDATAAEGGLRRFFAVVSSLLFMLAGLSGGAIAGAAFLNIAMYGPAATVADFRFEGASGVSVFCWILLSGVVGILAAAAVWRRVMTRWGLVSAAMAERVLRYGLR